MRAWRRLALVVLACAGLLPATPSRALDPEMRAAHYTVTRWSADDGLPHSQIHDIGQDPDGFLWVATWEGTARFDGLGFTPVRGLHEAAGGRLASRLVWRDDDGSMLVAIDGPGLLRASSDRAPGPACAGTAELPVARIAAAAGGGAWLAAADGLYRLRPGGRCERVPGGESLAGRAVNALLAQDDGSLWLGLPRGLYRWHGGPLEALGEGLGLPPGEVRALARDARGATWIAGEQGVWRHLDGRLDRMRGERAEGLLVDRGGAVWVAATDGMVLRYWEGRWDQLGRGEGVVGYATGALFEDREGLLLATGDDPDLRIRLAADPVFTVPPEEVEAQIHAMIDTDDTLHPLDPERAARGLQVIRYRETPGDGSEVTWHTWIEDAHQLSVGCHTRTEPTLPQKAACRMAFDSVELLGAH